MKKFLIYLTIFVAVFLGTATCIVANGYNAYLQNDNNQLNKTKNNPNSTVLTSMASNVLSSEQFGGTFNLTDNNKIDLDGSFAIENKNGQVIDVSLKGMCGNFYVDADVQYLNNFIYIDLNNTKIKLSTEDISSGIEALKLATSALTNTIETSSSSELPELDTDYLMQFLDKIKTTETETGMMIELAIPDLCNLYILTNKDSLPTQILINNVVVGSSVFTLNVSCNNTQKPEAINTSEYISISPVIEYIEPALLALQEDSLGISGQIEIGGNMLFIDATLKNKTKLSGKISFSNLTANFELKNDYLLVEFYGKVFKITIEDLKQLLEKINPTTLQGNVSQASIDFPNITPTISDGKLSRIEIQNNQIIASFDIGKSYFDSISIKETNTKSLTELVSALENFKSIVSNEYSLNISFEQNDISMNGNVYLTQNDLSVEKFYFSGKILDVPTTIIYENDYAYININNLKFKLSSKSLESVLNIVISTIKPQSQTESSLDISSLANINIINNIDFSARKLSFNSNNINAEITSYPNFYKANITSNDITINSTIYTSDTYKSIAKNLDKSEYKDYSEISALAAATMKTLEESYVHYSGKISIDLFNINIKNIGLEVEIFKNEKRIEVKLTNLPNNAILTYLSSIYYVGQNCHLTITENHVRIYTTTVVRLTGREVVVANKTIPISEFSIANLYDIMSLRKIYLKAIEKSAIGAPAPKVELSTDMLDIYQNETILTLTKFVENFASSLTITIQHVNTIESVSANLNIFSFIKINVSLTKVN